MKKLLLILIFGMFLISFASAQQQFLGHVKQNDCIEMSQTCPDCTYNNISRIVYSNKTTIAVSNVAMTKDDTYYNYTFCLTSELGTYNVHGYGDIGGTKTSWVYTFDVTGTGYELNQARTNFYLGFLFVLIFLFIVNLIIIPLLPSKDNYDEEGILISINQLKYIRPVLYVTAWFLLMSLVFVSSNLALAYLGTTLLGDLFFKIYYIMLSLSLPMIVIWFIFIFVSIFQDKKMKGYIERGIESFS